jgi:endonuclease-3
MSTVSSGVVVGSPEQVQFIVDELYRLYPKARYELDFTTPLELFVATQLAAQCTDVRVNAVTKDLFKKYRSAADYAGANPEELEQDVKPTGFYRKKAAQLRASCQYLLDHYNGEVPNTMNELVRVPGVARKTANVILGNAFGIVDGFKIERDLMALVPREHWLEAAHRIIYHGRAVCNARKPLCGQCTLASYCPSAVIE